MIVVIFEVWPGDGRQGEYMDHAGQLRAELQQVDGFISVERFQSLVDPGKLLSLSFWRDEASVGAWRNQTNHRATQAAGRRGIFRNYRIRVASVLRDYDMLESRQQAPDDSQRAHDSL
jgi:heme-degrading monooxygenase HmoA